MGAKRIVATTIAATIVGWLIAVSLSLRDSLSELTEFESHVTPPVAARVEPLPVEPLHVQTIEASGSTAVHSSTLREEVSNGLTEAWDCFRAENLACSSVSLNRLNSMRDLTDLERAQIIHITAALEAAIGKRNEAIRILRDQIPVLADLPDEFRAQMQGILASLYFGERRYREALDMVDSALELSPNDSLVRFREAIITVRSLRSRERLGEASIGQQDLILLNEIVE